MQIGFTPDKRETIMRKSRWSTVLMALFFLATLSGTSRAVPTLQLDIGGGIYNDSLQDIVATTNPFTLYALLTPDADSTRFNSYILSIAVTPQVQTPANLGSFTIDGVEVPVTGGMTYGTPPIAEVDNGGDLAGHSIFPTFFLEVPFTFDPSKNAPTYDTQYQPGGPDLTNPGPTYYRDWVISSNLFSGYFLHFDLYQLGVNPNNGRVGIVEFAPFSHDASVVPEPGTMMLLGTGLIGLASFGRKKFRK